MKTVHINFTSLRNMPFGLWCKWAKSEMDLFEFCTGYTLEEAQNLSLYSLETLCYWVEGLEKEINLEAKAISILNKSFQQKLDAVTIIQKSGNIYDCLPVIGAIFEVERKEYKGDEQITELEASVEKWENTPLEVAYPVCVGYLFGLQEYENYMKESLKEIPYTENQIDAGIKDFEAFAEYNTIYSLAKGDITKMDSVLKSPLAVVSRAIQYANMTNYYEYKMNETIISNLKNKK